MCRKETKEGRNDRASATRTKLPDRRFMAIHNQMGQTTSNMCGLCKIRLLNGNYEGNNHGHGKVEGKVGGGGLMATAAQCAPTCGRADSSAREHLLFHSLLPANCINVVVGFWGNKQSLGIAYGNIHVKIIKIFKYMRG